MPTPRPPQPRQIRPVQTWHFARRTPGFLTDLHAELGDVFGLHFQKHPWTVFTHPDAIKEIFTAPASALRAGEGNEILGPPLGQHSLLLLDGDEHMRQRRMLLPSFHGEKLAAQKAAMERVSETVVEKFPVGQPFSLRPQMQEIALEVIMEVVLGLDSTGPQHDFLSKSTGDILEWIGTPSRLVATGVLGPKHPIVKRMFRPMLAPLDAGIYELIAERRQATDLEERSDILSMMLLAADEDGNGMSDAEVRDELVTLIVAGHETTSTALSWAFERLTRDPAALKRLEDESRTDDTEWSDAVSKETLRLRPVLDFVVRRVGEPIEIAGYKFEPGEFVAPSIKLVHLREDIYPDATSFKPERWLDSKPGTYTWIPFGGGVRRCIGLSFAMAEMDVVMRAVARSVHLEPVGDEERVVSRFITSSPARGGEVLVPA